MQVSNFSLDWLSFTYKVAPDQEECLSSFWQAFPEFDKYRSEFVIVRGKYYSSGLCLDDDISIMYDEVNHGKGVNVQIPSHGLQHFFDLFGIDNVRDMFILLESRGCSPSRIDVCFDDYTKKYSPRYYLRKYDSKELLTRMKMINFYVDPVSGGETFSIGSRRKKMVRVYDKETQSDGEIPAVRYEIEMHSISALSFFKHIIESDPDEVVYFGDLLTDVFVIKKQSQSNKQRSRWEDNHIWFDFVKSSFSQRYISIPTYRPDQEIEKAEKYIEINNYSSFAYMIAVHGLKPVLKAVAEKGLTPKYIKYCRIKAEKLGLPPDYFLSASILNY